jgi:Rrf2 family cysteine metabolism transcriptional repressor
MKLSTRTRYGLRAMVELASYATKSPIMVRKIAEKQQISKKYLDIIFTSLKVAGLVRAIRGATGGFLLTRAPEAIRISEIVAALEGALAPVECCQSPEVCDRSTHCAAQQLWNRLAAAIQDTLDSTTLADLVATQGKLDAEHPFCPTQKTAD